MKHIVFLACIGLFILFTGCGGKKTETTSAGGGPRVIEVENVVAVQTATGSDGRPVFLVPFSVRWIRTGNISDGNVEVLSGLGKGEKVVAPYVREAQEGFQVTVKQ